MGSKKEPRSDFNAPLRSLSDLLRSLQKDATQLLDATRLDSRRAGPRSEGAQPPGGASGTSVREAQIGRVAANFLDRWDIPTRSDLDEIHQRLDRIEAAIAALRPPQPSSEQAVKAKRTSKTRRRRSGETD